MQRAESAGAMLVTGVVRAVCVVLGGTVAVHRLAAGIGPDGPAVSLTASLQAALPPDRAVIEAVGRTVLLAAPSLAVAALLGAAVAGLGRLRNPRPGHRPIGLGSVLALAVAVPGLAWLPVADVAEERGLVPDDAGLLDQASADTLRLVAFWSVLVGLAVAPAMAAALGRGRPWSRRGPGGHPALARLAGVSLLGEGGPVAVPTACLALVLAVVEIRAGWGGLFDRFADELTAGRAELLVPLALPIIVGGVLVTFFSDLSGHLIDTDPSSIAWASPGSALAGRGRMVSRLAVAALVVAVAVATVVGAVAERGGSGPTLRTSRAIGLGLAVSTLPATAAAAAGSVLAALRRFGPGPARVLDTLLGLLWWPAALVVPLAAAAARSADRPLADPTVLLVTGVVLVPPATWLSSAPGGSSVNRVGRLVSATAVATALAFAAHLVAGFAVPAASAGPTPLGQLVAEASSDPGAGTRAALLVPVGASVLVLAALWGVAAVAGADRRARPPVGEEAGSDDLVIHVPMAEREAATADLVLDALPAPDPDHEVLDHPADPGSGDDVDDRLDEDVDDAATTIELRPSLFRPLGTDQPADRPI